MDKREELIFNETLRMMSNMRLQTIKELKTAAFVTNSRSSEYVIELPKKLMLPIISKTTRHKWS